jgi:RNA polymerase sigma-70 factor (ECF subfamily)
MQEAVHLTGEALAALPDAQRQTIQMFFFDGLTLKDIAERRNETLANVRHHYYRGLDRLRSFFEAEVQTKTPKGSVLRLGEIRRVQT